MATIVLRSVKGSPLTTTEMDNNFTNLNTELGQKVSVATYTAADVLTKIKTVDGIGSGLDADFLDGLPSASSNTPNSVVTRDGSGNFSANQITATFVGDLSGNISGNATNVTGVVGVANGGTGVTSSTGSGAVVLRNAPTFLGVPVIQDGIFAIGNQGAGQQSIHIRYDGKIAIATSGVAGTFNDFLTSGNYQSQIQTLITGFNGIRTSTDESPLITKGINTFTSGNKNGLGRWGVFKEPNKIGFGIPVEFDDQAVKIFKYNANSTIASEATIITSANYNSYVPTLAGVGATGTWGISISGNATTATNLTATRSDWSTKGTITAVVGQLAWKNFGNGFTVFDASAGTSPQGTAIDKTNSQNAWVANYPTLMGWNGANTYGVRVDSSRISDSSSSAAAGSTLAKTTPKAWVTFDGDPATPTILASYNVSSITKIATGRYQINFTTPLLNGNVCMVGSAGDAPTIGDPLIVGLCDASPSTSNATIRVVGSGGGQNDVNFVCCAFFGD